MIPKEHLEAMGFIEIATDLYMKDLGMGTKIYRDYRNQSKSSYAYRRNQMLPTELFKELRSIEIIEKRVVAGTLLAFN